MIILNGLWLEPKGPNKTVCNVRTITVPEKDFPGIRTVTKLLGVAAEGREK
jgi:hypothetical protein